MHFIRLKNGKIQKIECLKYYIIDIKMDYYYHYYEIKDDFNTSDYYTESEYRKLTNKRRKWNKSSELIVKNNINIRPIDIYKLLPPECLLNSLYKRTRHKYHKIYNYPWTQEEITELEYLSVEHGINYDKIYSNFSNIYNRTRVAIASKCNSIGFFKKY